MSNRFEAYESGAVGNEASIAAGRFLEEVQGIGRNVPKYDPHTHWIDRLYADGMSRADSPEEKVKCADTARKHWEREMKSSYKSLWNGETAEEKRALVKSQQLWQKFKDADFDSIDDTYKALGADGKIHASQDKMDLQRLRAIELQNRDGKKGLGTPESRSHTDNPIDKKLNEGGKLSYEARLEEACKDWEKQMNDNLSRLSGGLGKEEQKGLKQAQDAWEEFRKSESVLVDKLTESRKLGGSRVENLAAKVDLFRQRSLQLEERWNRLH